MNINEAISTSLAWAGVLVFVLMLTLIGEHIKDIWIKDATKVPWKRIRKSIALVWAVGIIGYLAFFGRFLSSRSRNEITESKPSISYEQQSNADIMKSNQSAMGSKDTESTRSAKEDNDAAIKEAEILFSTNQNK